MNSIICEQRINEIVPMYNPHIIRLLFFTIVSCFILGGIILHTIPSTKVISGKTIISHNLNETYAIVYLPVEGTGEISNDMYARINILNYSQAEYGYLNGRVQGFLDNGTPDNLNMYHLKIRLTDGLKTSNGYLLSDSLTLQGTCDIIVKDRKFIDYLIESFYMKK